MKHTEDEKRKTNKKVQDIQRNTKEYTGKANSNISISAYEAVYGNYRNYTI